MGVREVVFRRMFDFVYDEKTKIWLEFDVDELIDRMREEYCLEKEGEEKLIGENDGIEIEVELRSCGCEILFPVLRPNGLIYKGWGKHEWK